MRWLDLHMRFEQGRIKQILPPVHNIKKGPASPEPIDYICLGGGDVVAVGTIGSSPTSLSPSTPRPSGRSGLVSSVPESISHSFSPLHLVKRLVLNPEPIQSLQPVSAVVWMQ